MFGKSRETATKASPAPPLASLGEARLAEPDAARWHTLKMRLTMSTG